MTEKRVMMITGASTGIGAATARQAKAAGFDVALGARSANKLKSLAEELGDQGVLTESCDVTQPEEVDRIVEATVKRYGRIDVLFANAGVGGEPGGLSSAPIESWRRIIDTNVFGLAVSIQKALPHIKKSTGHVLVTGSVAGRRTLGGSMYGVSKWAANAVGYNLREELRGTGVRVTVIEPGLVDTPFFDSPKPDALSADDVARTVLFAVESPPNVDVHELMVLPTPPKD